MKIPSWIKAAGAGIAAVIAAIGWVWFSSKDKNATFDNEKKAQKIKEDTYDKIKNTSAHDLVDGANNAADLRADSGRIAGTAKKRLRDRTTEIIQRIVGSGDDNGTDGGGGN